MQNEPAGYKVKPIILHADILARNEAIRKEKRFKLTKPISLNSR